MEETTKNKNNNSKKIKNNDLSNYLETPVFM